MNLASVVTSSLLNAQPFTIERKTGKFVIGAGFTANPPTNITAVGVITPATDQDLQNLPEGMRISGSVMSFLTPTPILIESQARGALPAQISDVLIWNGGRYKVMHLGPWQAYGFYKALGVLTPG